MVVMPRSSRLPLPPGRMAAGATSWAAITTGRTAAITATQASSPGSPSPRRRLLRRRFRAPQTSEPRCAVEIAGHFASARHRERRCSVMPARPFHSLVDLQAAINRYLAEHNQRPKPFIRTADPDRIIAKVNRGYQALASDR
jgi:hypothetical protein